MKHLAVIKYPAFVAISLMKRTLPISLLLSNVLWPVEFALYGRCPQAHSPEMVTWFDYCRSLPITNNLSGHYFHSLEVFCSNVFHEILAYYYQLIRLIRYSIFLIGLIGLCSYTRAIFDATK
jgi:hypothetical protein